MDAESVLPSFAAVSANVLAGAATATVVELDDPVEPQTVLTHLHTAAAVPGPLSVFIAGQLHLDRRQHLLHLALGRTTVPTLRYTAVPWHWITGALERRRPGTTVLVADLVADADAWEAVGASGLRPAAGAQLYGRIMPPPARGRRAVPDYLRVYAEAWRAGHRMPFARLHERAAAAGPPDAHFLAFDGQPPATVVPSPPPGAVPLPALPPRPPAAPHAAPVVLAKSGAQPAVPAADRSTPAAPSARGSAPVPVPPPVVPPVGHPAGGAGSADPHAAILAAAGAGRHGEAAAIAAAWESEALRAHGPGSAQAVHWIEVRADLARLAGDAARSCELWISAASARLTAGGAAHDPETEAAVDRAQHQWDHIEDPVRARRVAPALAELRRRVPGRQPGAAHLLERRLERLRTGSV